MLRFGQIIKERCVKFLESGIRWLVLFLGTINMFQVDLKEHCIYGLELILYLQKGMKAGLIAFELIQKEFYILVAHLV